MRQRLTLVDRQRFSTDCCSGWGGHPLPLTRSGLGCRMVHGSAMARVQGVDGPLTNDWTLSCTRTAASVSTTVCCGRRHQRFQRPSLTAAYLRYLQRRCASTKVRSRTRQAVVRTCTGLTRTRSAAAVPEQRSRRTQRWKYRMRRHRRCRSTGCGARSPAGGDAVHEGR